MQYMLDIIGSIMVAGMITLIILTLNTSMTRESMQTRYEWATQNNMSAMAAIIENDFYKIGSHVTAARPYITTAESTKIIFNGDIDANNSPDIGASYYTQAYTITGDKRQYYKLCRKKDNSSAAAEMNLGFTIFKLSYFDSTANIIKFPIISASQLDSIRSVKVVMQMESPFVFTEDTVRKPAITYWEKFISPKNLRYIK